MDTKNSRPRHGALLVGLAALLAGCPGPEATDTGWWDPSVSTDGPWTGNGCPGTAEPAAAFLYGETTVDLALTLDSAAIAGLAEEFDDEVPDVRGTFTYEGEDFPVGVRLHGGKDSFRPFEDKPSFLLNFEEFSGGATFHGLPTLILSAQVRDEGKLAERVASSLLAAAGVPSPVSGYARVTVNGERFGLYATIEDPQSRTFTERCLPPGTGALWEGEGGDFIAEELDEFSLVLDPGLADPTLPLLVATEELDEGGLPWFDSTLDYYFDVDSLIGLMAVELASGNEGGYVAARDNYYLYQGLDDRRLWTIGWGPGRAFGADLDPGGDHPARIYSECRQTECSAVLDARILAVADVMEDPHWRSWVLATAARTEADCVSDPRSDGDCLEIREAIYAFIDKRPAEVRAALGD